MALRRSGGARPPKPGVTTPRPVHGRTTDPNLLQRVGDWRDSQAWARFVNHYQPHLRAVCQRYQLFDDAADECSQSVWVKLSQQMRTFRYDPSQRFRGWLHTFFHHRVRDYLKSVQAIPVEERLTADVSYEPTDPDHLGGEDDPEIVAMLRLAEEVQTAVRARVTPENWRVFQLIALEGWAAGEVANLLDRQYTTVYRACRRVMRMVDEERRRRLGGP